MNLQYASDLHLEFPANKEFLKLHPLQSAGEILVLAGDILPLAVMDKHKDFFSYVSDNFETTYWLPGNHEYYHYDIANKSGVLNEKIRSYVFLVNDTFAIHDNIQLIFSTLWSYLSPGNQWQIEKSLNDFYQIKYKGFRFSGDQYNKLHSECLNFLQNELKNPQADKQVVFTHHCPAFLNYPTQYKGDILNEAFAVELFDLIESSKIDAWIYGHHHQNTPEFRIGETLLLTNQLGYVDRNKHLGFKTNKYFVL